MSPISARTQPPYVRCEPAKVRLDAGAREVVEDHDLTAFFDQAGGEVRADEAGAARDERPAGERSPGNPRAASSAVASSTRSSATCVSSQPASSSDARPRARPAACSRAARRASVMSAKQWRMSPTRYLPVTSGRDAPRRARAASRRRSPCTVMLSPAADVDDATVGTVAVEREPARARNVVDADEVAPLAAVLEDQRRPAVQEPRGEDREHAGVGVRQRLARAVDVEEAQRDRRARRRPSPKSRHSRSWSYFVSA